MFSSDTLAAAALRTPDVDAALRGPVALAAAAVLVIASAVLALALSAEVLRAAGRAGRVVGVLDRITPRPLRRTAAVAVAAAVLVGGTATGVAAGRTGAPGPDDPPVVADRDSLERRTGTPKPRIRDGRAPVPDSHAPAPDRRGPPASGPNAAGDTYVVEPGDCLWSIAARRLGPSATNAAVDVAWRRIYERNRAAVGDDPNLIHPGLVLALPPLTRPS